MDGYWQVTQTGRIAHFVPDDGSHTALCGVVYRGWRNNNGAFPSCYACEARALALGIEG